MTMYDDIRSLTSVWEYPAVGNETLWFMNKFIEQIPEMELNLFRFTILFEHGNGAKDS